MKIIYFLNNMDYGGSEVYARLVAKGLKNKGHTVVLVSNGGKALPELKKGNIKHIKVKFVFLDKNSVCELKLEKRILMSLLLSKPLKHYYNRHLLNEVKDRDVILTQHPFPSIIAAKYAKKFNKPVVNIVHGILPNEFSNIYKERHINFTKYIAISEEVKDFLIKEKKISSADIKVIMNPIIYPEKISFGNKQTKKVSLISHIRKDKWRSVENFIKSIEYLSQYSIKAEIVGNVSADYLSKTEQLCEKINQRVGKRIIAIKGLSKNLNEYFKATDIVIGVGRCAMASIARGKPTIISGHIISKTGGNFSGLVNSTNIDRISKYNFSGRDSSITATPEKLAKEIKKAMNLLDSKTCFKILIATREKAKKINEYHQVVNEIEKYLKNVF